MLDDNLLISHDDPFHDQSQHTLTRFKCWGLQEVRDALAERCNRLRPLARMVDLGDLCGDELFPLGDLVLGIPQALAPLFELVHLNGPDLIRVDEPLFLPLERRLLVPQPLEFPLSIAHVKTKG